MDSRLSVSIVRRDLTTNRLIFPSIETLIRQRNPPTLEMRLKKAEPKLCPTQHKIVQYCLGRKGEQFLPSEIYRSSKAVRVSVDETIKAFQELDSPAKVIWSYCVALANLDIGVTIDDSRYMIPTHEETPTPSKNSQ